MDTTYPTYEATSSKKLDWILTYVTIVLWLSSNAFEFESAFYLTNIFCTPVFIRIP